MKLRLDVKPDHLEAESKTWPLIGLAELIWNSLDADAANVTVSFERNQLGGISKIFVADDGHGFTAHEAEVDFGKLGGSWKKTQRRTRGEGRALHGQEGKGRYKAFALGDTIVWESVTNASGHKVLVRVWGKRPDLNLFDVSKPKTVQDAATGTVVEIQDLKDVSTLDNPNRLADILARRFAMYLRKYPAVTILIDGVRVAPAMAESYSIEYRLPRTVIYGQAINDARLNIIEWKYKTERALYLCDPAGFARHAIQPGVRAKGWSFTAYLSSKAIPLIEDRGGFSLEGMDPGFDTLIEAARKKMKEHFARRDGEIARNIVDNWVKAGIYPYEGDPKTVLQTTERQVFDVVAIQLSNALPKFKTNDTKSQKLAMRLLRQVIESNPQDLESILSEVLDLTLDQQSDLAELLKRTSLAAIISSAKLVADRLNFLRGLEILLFNEPHRTRLKERAQLHRILEDHTWLWGEEFALSVSDQGLDEVLANHLAHLRGTDKRGEESPVRREDGSRGIVDLMLSRLIPSRHSLHREHLVVELKRPSVEIDLSIISQGQSYADAIAADERFRDTNTIWSFWLLGNSLKPSARNQAHQANRPAGLTYESQDGRVKVWVKTWGEILQENRARLEFMQNKLQYKVTDESALGALQKMHAKYLPPLDPPPLEESQGDFIEPLVADGVPLTTNASGIVP